MGQLFSLSCYHFLLLMQLWQQLLFLNKVTLDLAHWGHGCSGYWWPWRRWEVWEGGWQGIFCWPHCQGHSGWPSCLGIIRLPGLFGCCCRAGCRLHGARQGPPSEGTVVGFHGLAPRKQPSSEREKPWFNMISTIGCRTVSLNTFSKNVDENTVESIWSKNDDKKSDYERRIQETKGGASKKKKGGASYIFFWFVKEGERNLGKLFGVGDGKTEVVKVGSMVVL